MKIVILDGGRVNVGNDLSWEGFKRIGELTSYEDTPKDLIIPRLKGFDAAIVNNVKIDKVVMEACPDLKYIGLFATGYNGIDIQYAKERGIVVCNVPGYSGAAVAQHSIALLLAISNHIEDYSEGVHREQWANDQGGKIIWGKPPIELCDQNIGIIGFGDIGRRVGKIAQALGMNVFAHAPSKKPGEKETGCQYLSLEEIYEQSDIISLHCPLKPETEKMINAKSIAKMKDGAILINTARGGLIDETALAKALESGKIKAAGLDVVAQEPLTKESPLFDAPNCLITPHNAWSAWATRKRVIEMAVANLKAFTENRTINNVASI